jgi:hypothetical protein
MAPPVSLIPQNDLVREVACAQNHRNPLPEYLPFAPPIAVEQFLLDDLRDHQESSLFAN